VCNAALDLGSLVPIYTRGGGDGAPAPAGGAGGAGAWPSSAGPPPRPPAPRPPTVPLEEMAAGAAALGIAHAIALGDAARPDPASVDDPALALRRLLLLAGCALISAVLFYL